MEKVPSQYKGANRSQLETNETVDPTEKRGKGRTLLKMGAVAGTLVALSAPFALEGHERGKERNAIMETNTTVTGGEAEIIKFDSTFEEHCWTATTLRMTGAKSREDVKTLGVGVSWFEVTVGAELEQKECVGDTKLETTVNRQTGEMTVNVPNKDSIYSHISVVPGSIEESEDFPPSYALAQGVVNAFKSTPFLEDTDLAQALHAGSDLKSNKHLNMALVNGMHDAFAKCRDVTSELAKPAVGEGILNLYKPGMAAVQPLYPEIDPDNIILTVEGVPYADVKLDGGKSNVDEAYKAITDFDKANDNFSITPGELGECKVSDEIKQLANTATTSTAMYEKER